MIKNSVTSSLESLPVGHSDRLMSLRLPLRGDQYATIISVYAPILQADLTTKEALYSELRSLLQKTKDTDKIFILGDFNARVSRDHSIWPRVLGRHCIGNCNDNGRLLLELCSERSLIVTNTLFQQKARFKTTWKHPLSKHWHLLDYILVRQKDVKDVLHTRVMPSADCYTDHRLVRATIKPAVKRRRPQIKTLQVNRLHLLKEEFQSELERTFAPTEDIETDPEKMWQDLKDTLQKTTAEVAGFSSRKNKDWFDENDEEIQQLLQDKRSCHQRVLSNPGNQEAKSSYRQAPELDEPPSLEEVKRAVKKIQAHKAPGIDGLPTEVYKYGGDQLLEKLTSLFTLCWEKGEVLGDLRDAVIVSMYKNKGEKSDCSNYRGVTCSPSRAKS